MESFDIVINRKQSHSGSIIGDLLVNGTRLCYTLELPWRWNAHNVSCIPNGRYAAHLRYDKTDHWRIQLDGVPGRGGVQIHMGNYPHHSKGCILVGMIAANNSVLHSAAAYSLLKQTFYGTLAPHATPEKQISVTFRGILATPWGDFAGRAVASIG